ncbi:MAG: sensor histidine kinase [Ruminococcaceae bacterium]|nr:sensor histidine kinase [Oscillospiraceae bacterium]
MKELSLNILDITENSVKAKATLISITITEDADMLTISIADNGTGMTEETVRNVTDPFYTTRTTRKVGMGLPLFKFAAEQTGGTLAVNSKHFESFPDSSGTTVTATFYKKHIDFTPLGDVISSLTTLIQGHPDIDFVYRHDIDGTTVASLDTRELRAVLEDVPLDTFEVLTWINENLAEQYNSI